MPLRRIPDGFLELHHQGREWIAVLWLRVAVQGSDQGCQLLCHPCHLSRHVQIRELAAREPTTVEDLAHCPADEPDIRADLRSATGQELVPGERALLEELDRTLHVARFVVGIGT